jgi:TonB family protein
MEQVFNRTTDQERALRFALILSMGAHLVFFLLWPYLEIRTPLEIPDDEEMVIDTSMLDDFGTPDKTALPEPAKKAEEAKVPENLLPQLPKQFTPKETVEEKGEPVPDEEEKKVEKKEEKPPEPPKEEKKQDEPVPSDPEEKNKIDLAEIRKRKVMEMLRKQEQTAKTSEAPNADAAVKLAEALQKGGIESTGSVSAKLAAQKYRALLQAAVRRNYNLPDAYNFKSANLSVLLEMVVNARGEIASLEVKEPSGDAVFDEMTVRAAQQSAPLPVPPPELAGVPIFLQFKP